VTQFIHSTPNETATTLATNEDLLTNHLKNKITAKLAPAQLHAAQHKHSANHTKPSFILPPAIPVLARRAVLLFFNLKSLVMSASIRFSGRRRKWVSYTFVGCYYNRLVYVTYRCPLINGVPMVHLSWLHKMSPAE